MGIVTVFGQGEREVVVFFQERSSLIYFIKLDVKTLLSLKVVVAGGLL